MVVQTGIGPSSKLGPDRMSAGEFIALWKEGRRNCTVGDEIEAFWCYDIDWWYFSGTTAFIRLWIVEPKLVTKYRILCR